MYLQYFKISNIKSFNFFKHKMSCSLKCFMTIFQILIYFLKIIQNDVFKLNLKQSELEHTSTIFFKYSTLDLFYYCCNFFQLLKQVKEKKLTHFFVILLIKLFNHQFFFCEFTIFIVFIKSIPECRFENIINFISIDQSIDFGVINSHEFKKFFKSFFFHFSITKISCYKLIVKTQMAFLLLLKLSYYLIFENIFVANFISEAKTK